MAISSLIQYFADKLGPIIDGNGLGKTDSCGGFVPTDGRIDQKQWASSSVLIDNDENVDGAVIGQPIANKVHRPALLCN